VRTVTLVFIASPHVSWAARKGLLILMDFIGIILAIRLSCMDNWVGRAGIDVAGNEHEDRRQE
jgi:hypothetical protein